ncbi:MAG TPA: 7,8-didemethyl-8-hydroxy-5-deazariboflavin synthase CofG, partial [Actinomycetota bacterium]|nr:7,8-didemethyl-8-hydroxy-5-deazariboflavin synthase CofG [Actinomycetota bacterium]
MTRLVSLTGRAREGERLDDHEIRELAELALRDPDPVVEAARMLRDDHVGPRITYSKKVFIPLTQLCRDACGYCTFAHPPRPGERAYMTMDEVLAVARAGAEAGCKEALFTLGDKPERKWAEARNELDAMGYSTTIEYLVDACRTVLDETGLLPHANPGALTVEEAAALRDVTVSQGTMLETLSERLLKRGMAHFGAPDKKPAVRLATLEAAGVAQVPFTTGILVGIGETYAERIDALLAIRASHERHGHIQEVIVQNFRAKPDILMRDHPEPSVDDMLLAIAMTRLIMGPEVGVQAPPNLTPQDYGRYLDAGLSDWGGVSPVTPDHVNPEAPWPHLDELRDVTEGRGHLLMQRLAVYPGYCGEPAARERWLAPGLRAAVLDAIDAEGYRRPENEEWFSGVDVLPPVDATRAVESARAGAWRVPGRTARRPVMELLDRVGSGDELAERDIALLFTARGVERERLFDVADSLRREAVGDEVTYVVNRNINFT